MSYQLALQALEEIVEDQELECADNFRIARADDEDAVARYEEQADNGCCGFLDTEFYDADRNLWLIGCNYGH